MSKKQKLLEKLNRKPLPRNYTKIELDALMKECGCNKFSGGRGSGIGYVHKTTGRILQFDEPHPGNELYLYQVKEVLAFLKDVREI